MLTINFFPYSITEEIGKAAVGLMMRGAAPPQAPPRTPARRKDPTSLRSTPVTVSTSATPTFPRSALATSAVTGQACSTSTSPSAYEMVMSAKREKISGKKDNGDDSMSSDDEVVLNFNKNNK